MEISQNIISEKCSILEALRQLNSLKHGNSLTLFVVDSNTKIVGTLTDGDIRRALIKEIDLMHSVGSICRKDFTYIDLSTYDVEQIHIAKEKGIELLPILNGPQNIVDIINLKLQKSLLPVDAVLMAGGKGERLRPLTNNMPKPLIPLKGKAIIDYNIESLISYGIKHINVTVNYLGEQIFDHFAEPVQGIQVRCVKEPKFLGTLGSIKFIQDFYNDTILVMNSDLFTNIDYEQFYLDFKENKADIAVATIPYDVSVPFGVFDMDEDDVQIKGVIEKPNYTYYANAGIYLIKKSMLDLIPENEFFNATDLIQKGIDSGLKVIKFPIAGYWIDIGQHSELKRAEEMIKYMK